MVARSTSPVSIAAIREVICRHLPDDELADVGCTCPVLRYGEYFATVVWLPVADGEWARANGHELYCCRAHGLISLLAVEPDSSVVDVELADWDAPEDVGHHRGKTTV